MTSLHQGPNVSNVKPLNSGVLVFGIVGIVDKSVKAHSSKFEESRRPIGKDLGSNFESKSQLQSSGSLARSTHSIDLNIGIFV
ncbi:hypothetical protein MTP99_015829 [Tenebrio molitor]|nr:hypothetical protein MTP99_015829 [Tenebrio molitor]